MDRDWLAAELAAGRSIEGIARDAEKNPSTVAYWVNKHGLVSRHATRHRPRGGVEASLLRALVEDGRSVREIAAELDLSASAVRYWLRKFGLQTQPSRYVAARAGKPASIVRECRTHGHTRFDLARSGRYRCALCNAARVAGRRRRVKEILVAEAGGHCVLCGYGRYAGALQFHHLDPKMKSFEMGGRGLTRAIHLLREEARKCILLCANCHAEVEAGVVGLPCPGH